MAVRRKVLLIDDSVALRDSVAGILRDKGFEVREAADGYEGLNKLRLHAFDVVISDVEMSGLSGIEFVRTARAAGFDLPIFLTSAGARYEAEALAAGASAFVLKTGEVEDYLSLLE
jgi:CheY-like chemotaxis protein